MLRMLQRSHFDVDPRSVENGQRLLLNYLSSNPDSSVTWEKLTAEKWVRVVWGRWYVPFDLRSACGSDQPDQDKGLILALQHLSVASRQRQLFAVQDGTRLIEEHRRTYSRTPDLEALLADGFLTEQHGIIYIKPYSQLLHAHGSWLAARLWDRSEFGPAGLERLSWWRERTLGVGLDWLDFGEYLGSDAREEFRKAAWDRILSEADLLDWAQERERYAAQAAARSGYGNLERGLTVIDTLPDKNPVARLRWIDAAGRANENQEEREEIGALIRIIIRWRQKFRNLGAWDAWARDFLDAAESRPYLLYEMNIAVARHPAVAADLLLIPEGSALALATLAPRTRIVGRGWNWGVKENSARSIELSVWKEVAEFAAWSLHQLRLEDRATHIASVLNRFAELAGGAATRGDELSAFRYDMLREAVVRLSVDGSIRLAFDDVGTGVVRALDSVLRSVDVPIEAPAFGALAWLATFGADDESPWRAEAVDTLIDAYQRGFGTSFSWYRDISLDVATWKRVVRWLIDNDQERWKQLLEPADFGEVAQQIRAEGTESHTAWCSLLHKVRTHLSLLLELVAGWEDVRRGEPVPHSLAETILSLVGDWITSEGERPSAIAAEVDVEFFEPRRESLLVAIARAMPRVSTDVRARLLELLLPSLGEVRQLATFQSALEEGPARDAVRRRLVSIPIFEGMDEVYHLDEVRRSVDALIAAEEVDRAEAWLHIWAEKARERRIHDWLRWETEARFRIDLTRKRFDEIVAAPLPVGGDQDYEVRRTYDFYRGVAMLHLTPPMAQEAVSLYERLTRDWPEQPVYAANLFAARTQLLTREVGDAGPTQEQDDALRDLLLVGEVLMSRFTLEQRSLVEQTYQVNRLYLFNRLRDWKSLLASYQLLPTSLQKSPELAAHAATALESAGQPELAAVLRADTGGTTDIAAESLGNTYADEVEATRLAILRVVQFSMTDQAKAWWGRDLALGIEETILDACCALTDIAPVLARRNGRPPEEDRITKLLVELLRQRLHKLGWQVSSQEHGGYTAKNPTEGKGGIGERDLEIRVGSAHVVVGEALISEGFDANNFTVHLGKLFGYAPAGIPVVALLIWSFGSDPNATWNRYVEEIVKERAPAGHGFVSWIVPATGPISHVWHAISEHAHPDSGKCRVIHVLADFEQNSSKLAAKSARAP
jgi:hypothetical protein